LWIKFLAAYQIYDFFLAKPESIEEEILQLKISAVAKFDAKPCSFVC